MFETQLLSTKQRTRTRKWLTFPVALIAHGVLFGGLIVASFMTVESVQAPPITISFVAAPPPPPPPPPPPARKKRTKRVTPKEIPKPEAFVQPTLVPEEQPVPLDAPEEDFGLDDGVDGGVEGGVEGGVVGGVLGGMLGGVLGGMLGGVDGGLLDQPLYAGVGGVTNPELISSSKVRPKYPEIARKAKIQGKVVLQAIIRKNGVVSNVQVLRSPGRKFGFDEAAIAAVRQWRYKPGLQNGKPVDVYFTVVVDFVLQ